MVVGRDKRERRAPPPNLHGLFEIQFTADGPHVGRTVLCIDMVCVRGTGRGVWPLDAALGQPRLCINLNKKTYRSLRGSVMPFISLRGNHWVF